MDNTEFTKRAKEIVAKENKVGQFNASDIKVVWLAKAAGNNKALLCFEDSSRYYEVTYIGDEDNFVLDVYELISHHETN